MFNRFCERLNTSSGGPPPAADPPNGSPNIIHNSRFQVRNKTGQASVNLAVATVPTQQARRWYGYCDSSGFRTELSSANTMDHLVVKRYTGDTTDPWRIVQVYDTEDSLRLVDKAFTFCVTACLKNSSTNSNPLKLSIYSGTGTDEDRYSLVSGGWTGQSLVVDFDFTLTDTYQDFIAELTLPAGVTQFAIQLSSSFPLTNSANDEIWIKQITAAQNPSVPSLDSKSLALHKAECDRYFQELDLYLTTTKISIPIYMRSIPTITIPGGTAVTTTGTTADTLIINRNSGSGSVGVQLSSEL